MLIDLLLLEFFCTTKNAVNNLQVFAIRTGSVKIWEISWAEKSIVGHLIGAVLMRPNGTVAIGWNHWRGHYNRTSLYWMNSFLLFHFQVALGNGTTKTSRISRLKFRENELYSSTECRPHLWQLCRCRVHMKWPTHTWETRIWSCNRFIKSGSPALESEPSDNETADTSVWISVEWIPAISRSELVYT